MIQQKDVPKLRDLLEKQGLRVIVRDDTSAWNFVLGDDKEHFHSLTGNGMIDDQRVRCISAEYMIKFHSGYTLDQNDVDDVTALCERFGIELPEVYRKMVSGI